MDLRPKIVAEMIEALLDDLEDHSQLEAPRALLRERWTPLLMECFRSRRIPKGCSVAWAHSDDPDDAATFLDKYPALVAVVEAAEEQARQVWGPETQITTHLSNDPEVCGYCQEAQSLVVQVIPGKERTEKQWWKDVDAFDALLYAEGTPFEGLDLNLRGLVIFDTTLPGRSP